MPPRKSVEKTEETNSTLHQNMRFYGKVQDTPKEARKEIGAGRLKGYTDINPMWRIKKLTEVFGPAGFGWWTQNEIFTFEECKTGETAVFCKLELVVVDPETEEPSHPITGVGGNKFVANEKNGPYCNDEAMKMAYTDALSIACKSLGFSHDIYYQADRTKYTALDPAADDPAALRDRITKGIAFVTKDMSTEEKDKFANEVITKHIGSPNYIACKDVDKLKALLDDLLSYTKKTA